MRFILCALCGLIASFLTAQESILTPLTTDAFCKPGVINKSPSKGILLEYGIRPDYNISTSINTGASSEIERNKQWLFKFKIPVIRRENFKFLLGASHYAERFNFNFISRGDASLLSDLDGKKLTASRISAYFIKSLNDKWYSSLKLEVAANGDYDKLINFDQRYAIYRAAFMVARKKRDDLEYGMGLLFNKSFRRTVVVPFFLYNQTFNDKWGVEAALPVKIRMRYNLNERSLLLFGPEFKSRTFSVDLADDAGESGVFHLRNAELQLGISYQHRISKWLWTEFKGGYSHPFSTRFERKTGDFSAFNPNVNEINAQPTGAPFFRIGLFLSPPKHLMK